jgi:hypothetical protein
MKQLNFFNEKRGTYLDIIEEKGQKYRIWLPKYKRFSLDEAKEAALKIYNKQRGFNLGKDNNLIGFGEIVLNGKIFRKEKKEAK